MGAGSSKDGGPLAELTFSWVLKYAESALKYASSSSLVVIDKAGTKLLTCAFQAAEAAHEGDRRQHLRFTLSRDGGNSWSESKCVMWGAAPLWSPTLHYDAGRHIAGAGRPCQQRRFKGGWPSVRCMRPVHGGQAHASSASQQRNCKNE